jgi:hypothetical protein
LDVFPCQYQVIPEGGLFLVKVLLPQLLVDTLIADGIPGVGFTVTLTER